MARDAYAAGARSGAGDQSCGLSPARRTKNLTDFQSLGLAPRLVARLADQGITTPTPIQAQAIPHALAGRDVMGLAPTGTGNTAAFGLPLVEKVSKPRERVNALLCLPI